MERNNKKWGWLVNQHTANKNQKKAKELKCNPIIRVVTSISLVISEYNQVF